MKSRPVFGRLGETELVAQPAEFFIPEGIMKKVFGLIGFLALIISWYKRLRKRRSSTTLP